VPVVHRLNSGLRFGGRPRPVCGGLARTRFPPPGTGARAPAARRAARLPLGGAGCVFGPVPPAAAPPAAEAGLPLSAVERTVILDTLAAAGGNKSEAARRLGITRRTLHKKLKAYGVMA